MFQSWLSLTFLHWPFPPEEIQTRLPAGLSADLFDQTAWIGLTPFLLSDLRAPFLPPLPVISRFPETNLRTYVRGPNGERGIWFFTLEAARVLAVAGARLLYGLPYHFARMRVTLQPGRVEYQSARPQHSKPARTRISIAIGDKTCSGELETFLTARFRLYTVLLGKLAAADVEHEPWPLYQARALSLEQTLIESEGLPAAEDEPLVHYSPGVHVRIGAPHRL
jgi:uncharacterized protein YqjF (DUF2071 family)